MKRRLSLLVVFLALAAVAVAAFTAGAGATEVEIGSAEAEIGSVVSLPQETRSPARTNDMAVSRTIEEQCRVMERVSIRTSVGG